MIKCLMKGKELEPPSEVALKIQQKRSLAVPNAKRRISSLIETMDVIKAHRAARLSGNYDDTPKTHWNQLLKRDRQNQVEELSDLADLAARAGNHGVLYEILFTPNGKANPPAQMSRTFNMRSTAGQMERTLQ